MGFHYATQDGEPAAVAAAIEEQYLPRHAGDRLPASAAGRALAIADRADMLAGVFALGKRPSGNKDPFGLRRAALGLLRILVEDGVDLDLAALLARAIALQPCNVKDPAALAVELFDFIIERGRAWYLEGLAPGLPAGAVTAETFEAVRLRASGLARRFSRPAAGRPVVPGPARSREPGRREQAHREHPAHGRGRRPPG